MTDIRLLDIDGIRNCFFVLSTAGNVIYSSDGNDLSAGTNDNILELIDENSPASSLEIGYILNSVYEVTIKMIKIGGTDYITAFAPISGRPWTLAAILPVTAITRTYDRIIAFTTILVVVMVCLMIASMLFLTARVKKIRDYIGGVVNDSISKVYLDSITGHDSWGSFEEDFASALKNTSVEHAVISLDVDRFKAVNAAFGYDGGNSILKRISELIGHNIGRNDFYARSSGDRFYIMKEFSDLKELSEFSERMISDIENNITEIRISVSIGIYIISDKSIKPQAAVDKADLARKSVKGAAESRCAFFDTKMLERIRNEKNIENIMDDALELGEFLVYLQPKFDLQSDKGIVGAEALVRWRHGDKLIPPGEFIPLFEKNGFVMKLDYYMFEQTCKLQKKWKNMGFEPVIISVNMSRLHIHSLRFIDELKMMCEKYEIETKYFEIEITESAAYENLDVLCDVFSGIKKAGFHVSIDDFGTGYSSLNMLKDLPVDVLKIDRSFLTENADEHENASRIIGCLVDLAASLGIHTICEGIETKEQAALLRKLGCNMAQGFYFARPMPVKDFEKLTYGIEE